MTTRFEAEQADTQRQRKGAKSFKDGVNQNVTNSKGNSHLVQKPGLPQSGLDGATVQQPSAVSTRHTFNKSHAPRWWQRLSLRTKATAIAIALSTIPIVALGATAYYLTNKNITQSITQQHQARVISLANQLDRFILDHYRDIQTLSQLSILNNPSVRAVTSATQKQAVLNQFIKNNPAYDSIVVTDLSGNVILQSAGEVITNYSEIDYFQEVRRTNRPVITTPRKSKATGEYSIFFAAPVVDTATGRTIAIVRSRTPVRYFNEILQTEAKELAQNIPGFGSEEYFALNNVGTIVVAPTAHIEYIGKNAQAVFPTAARLQATDAVGSVVDIDRLEQEEYLISYSPVAEIAGLPNLNWSVMVAQPAAEVFAARRGLLLLFTIATLVTLLLVAAIAAYLAKRATRPILAATKAVEKLGQGELDTRIAVGGEDELAVLGSNINRMADQLQIQLQKQEADAERSQQFADITLLVRRSLNMQDILNTAVKEVRKVLKTDRVVIYRFDPEWNGTVIAESVGSDWTPALGAEIEDTCFRQDHGELYKKGRIRAIDNIYQAGLTDCHIRLLERFEVKANLIAPIQTDNQLLGLLITHQCSFSRAWQQSEIDLFTHLAIQIGFALDQASLLEQVEKSRQQAEVVSREQRQQKESLQRQLMELLTDIEGASSGDLTVRAEVTAGEIGTVADFFNAIIESLRQIVTSVKKAAGQVNVSVGQNEGAIQRLADEALKQAEEITRTLDSVEQMTLSIQAVADNARLAAEVARTASTSAEAGGAAMDLTVQSILNLRDTVAQTANKVKRLGESSQQISKVVFLINQIALQTNVLAINASIEAARAGEEGRGFAVVAEEVGQLAAKSSQATKEIEHILENIQLETNEVVRAMELGTTQVIEGTHLVEDTKKSLGQILNVSRQIDQLVQSISSATVTQAQTSVAVTDLMKEIAKVSERTANASRQVSGSLQQTVEVAQQLQASVGEFKVGAQS